jgi:hypothetical protein
MIRIGKACANSAKRNPMPPRPRIASVFPVTSWVKEGETSPFHRATRKLRSAWEKWRKADIIRYSAVVAVPSSTATGVLETIIPKKRDMSPIFDMTSGSGPTKNCLYVPLSLHALTSTESYPAPLCAIHRTVGGNASISALSNTGSVPRYARYIATMRSYFPPGLKFASKSVRSRESVRYKKVVVH